ncbi:MAG TPA: NAD-dependent epimerase/dehydratase family protein [Candidatus Nitrosocosmicus sp.]|nr:NAD-dependent epimerase/dehydratase family protein [Candidatus Nitrosocosmicus sp.]
MNRVLITGAAGFVGSNLARRLVKDGRSVHIVVRPQTSLDILKDIIGQIEVHIHDGTTEGMMGIMKAAKPQLVFHLAAFFVSEHDSEDVERLIGSNILLGTQLLESMKKTGVEYIINAGTSWQHYDNHSYSPVNLYAAAKQAFQDISKYYTESAPMRMLTLKLTDTYGPNDPRPKLMSLFKRIAKSGEILGMSGGEQLLGLVYIDDVMEAFVQAMGYIAGMPEHYNECFGVMPARYYKLREVAEIYEKAAGSKLSIEWGARPYRSREMMQAYCGKPLEGWKARTDLKEGILLMLEAEK